MVAADTRIGRLVAAARPARTWLHLTVSPWWARVLIAAGAQPTSDDSMTETFAREPVSDTSSSPTSGSAPRVTNESDSSLGEE